jgi:Ig-like domain-containing protein
MQATTTADYDFTFLGHNSLPPGTYVTPGAELSKYWIVTNTGTQCWHGNCDCEKRFNVRFKPFHSNNLGDDPTLSICQKYVDPGQTITISRTIKVPNAPGSYTDYFRLMTSAGIEFGPVLTCNVVVERASILTAQDFRRVKNQNTSWITDNFLLTFEPKGCSWTILNIYKNISISGTGTEIKILDNFYLGRYFNINITELYAF